MDAARALLGVLLLASAGVGVAIVVAYPSGQPATSVADGDSATVQAAGAPPVAAKEPARAGVAAGAPGAYSPPRPLLWKVSDDDNEVYLLGSFHALKAGDYPVAPSVDAAFADAELLVFEVSPEEMASPELAQAMALAGLQPAGSSLQQSIDAALWQKLEAYASKRGLPIETFQMLEPWLVSLMISLGEMGRIGYDPAQGLDQQLVARAAGEGKRTAGLETAASQIEVLDGMSAAEQRQQLAEALDDADKFEQRIGQLHDLWRRGDETGLEDLLAVDFRQKYAQLYQRINIDRNRAWVPQLRRLLDESKSDDALVVVGTLHLLGADGVVSQLKAQGYRVQRL